MNSPSYANGIKGESFSSDGTTAGPYVIVRDAPDLDGREEFAVSFWAKRHSSGALGHLLLKHVAYSLEWKSGGLEGYIFTADGTRHNISVPMATDSDWHHYALSYDGTALRFYLDAAEVCSIKMSGPLADNTRDLYIGKNPWGSSINGQIDELKIYERALNVDEIAAHAK